MRRRVFMTLLVSAAVASPIGVLAQQPTRVPLAAILSDETPALAGKFFEPSFAQGLRDLGWAEGQNISVERRYAEGKDEILPGLASELVRLQPDVIVAIGTPAARAAKTATQTIPVVFARISDPIGLGLVPSLARPGGNLTGLSVLARELDAKRLELLLTAAPDAKRVGALWDPGSPSAGPELREIEEAATSLNLELVPAEVGDPGDIGPAIAAIVEQRARAVIVVPGLVLNEHSRGVAELTTKAVYRRYFRDGSTSRRVA
jgi:putative ABC transport system substrate-binding protein